MTKFATFDDTGKPTAFYSDEAFMHGARMRPVFDTDVFGKVIGTEPNPDCKIPPEAVEITEEQYREFLDNAGQRKWQGGQVVIYQPAPVGPTADAVWTERDRRMALGFDYDFGDARGVHHIGTTPSDMVGWDDVTKLASARLALADTTPIGILTDTGYAEISPTEWQQILLAAGAFRQPIWAASFVLAAMSPIPADYADDSYWTTA